MKVHIEFDENRILIAVKSGNIAALRRAGAYVRKSARNKVSQSPKASAPGTPPNTRSGLLKKSLLRAYKSYVSNLLILYGKYPYCWYSARNSNAIFSSKELVNNSFLPL